MFMQLGAGTSLPGLVAAKVGAHVTLTDDLNRVEVLALLPYSFYLFRKGFKLTKIWSETKWFLGFLK